MIKILFLKVIYPFEKYQKQIQNDYKERKMIKNI